MEHIFNCHGEWLVVLQGLAALPLVGVWFRMCFHKHDHEPKP